MRWGWISFRALRWPVLVMVAGTALALLIGRFGVAFGAQEKAQFADMEMYAFLAGWSIGILWMLGCYWRLWSWEQGKAPACDLCSGPLGWKQDGKVIRGRLLPDYGLCWNCGRNRPIE